jgi:CcmD family protein
MNYLYAAYGVTWAIHIVYIITLNARARRLRREWDEFRRGNRTY